MHLLKCRLLSTTFGCELDRNVKCVLDVEDAKEDFLSPPLCRWRGTVPSVQCFALLELRLPHPSSIHFNQPAFDLTYLRYNSGCTIC